MRELIEQRLAENEAMRQQNLARLQQLRAEQEQLVADINANTGAEQALRVLLADLDKTEAATSGVAMELIEQPDVPLPPDAQRKRVERALGRKLPTRDQSGTD